MVGGGRDEDAELEEALAASAAEEQARVLREFQGEVSEDDAVRIAMMESAREAGQAAH